MSQGLGVLLLSMCAWFIYAGWTGIAPLKTIAAILAKPGSAESIIADERLEAVSLTTPTSVSLAGKSVISSGDAGTVIAYARLQLGLPYRLGGAGPNSWDCSGLTMKAFQAIGVTMLHSAAAQHRMGVPIIRKSDLQPGDLLFPLGDDHVQIYTGGGNIIEAAKPGTNVRERGMWGFSGDAVDARRIIKKAN